MSSGCCPSIQRSTGSGTAGGGRLPVALLDGCVDFSMTVFPKHAFTQGSPLLAALFPQFSMETLRMPFVDAREGSEASARLTSWEMYYIWKTCWLIANVSVVKRVTCSTRHWGAALRAQPGSRLCPAPHCSVTPVACLGQEQCWVLTDVMCAQTCCTHGCDVLMDVMCSEMKYAHRCAVLMAVMCPQR